MDLHQPLAARAAVEAVDVLGGQEEAVAEARLEGHERVVAGVGRAGAGLAPPLGVEAPHEGGVPGEPFGRGDLLHRVLLPEARPRRGTSGCRFRPKPRRR